MKTIVLTTTAILALGSVAGCSSLSDAGGRRSNTPDEFKVVTKAPLTVPPEYSLRPPGVGQARPTELVEDNQPAPYVFGTNIGADATLGEKLFVAAAQATAADPLIRVRIDYEQAQTLRKPREFADEVLSTGDTAAAEASDSATGGGDVIIARDGKSPKVKLPGT